MDRLTPLDDGFIELERDELPMHIGSLLLFEGPPPDYEDMLATMASRLHRLPRYRQRVREVPLHLGLPAWEDDPYFRLTYHVRHTAVPHPGGPEQIRTLAGRLLSQRLDMRRPLWEMWLIEGLSDGGFAILNKVHHSMVDGLSGADIMELILDRDPNPPVPAPVPWSPQAPAGTVRVVAEGVVDSVRDPLRRLRHLAADLSEPAAALGNLAATAVGTLRFGRELAHVEDHLMGRPGPHRRWDWAVGDLDQVKDIKRTLGGTVNDVILTAIASGFREFLLSRHAELAPDSIVRTMVPVSTRPPEEDFGGNQVAVVFADLPVGVADPGHRYGVMRDQMNDVKRSGLLEGTDALLENAVFVPPLLWAAAGRLAARTPQPAVATITTNVPGPQYQLFSLGRPMRTMLPYVPLGMNQLITVAIMSYHGGITCGVTADYDRVPDVRVLCAGIESGLADLADLAR